MTICDVLKTAKIIIQVLVFVTESLTATGNRHIYMYSLPIYNSFYLFSPISIIFSNASSSFLSFFYRPIQSQMNVP